MLKDGEINDAGTHEELLGHRGLYHSMWEAYTMAAGWEIGEAQQREAVHAT
ncbi:hypothetical protein D3C71_2203430 [compost metagenome]